ncbi:DUF1465 family protein [Sphingomonas nostoxanthinifaciens]|uniref:DUF1465 family protein n=1 Tax=Sphingomonas nostoxanthinifaciens TaxID=2872652 RepID=UPI001CC1C63D|nr:DUF1465 family protein [Sphingomonas nostoxanthinifaciens]UAK23474.1 DUF1465 family protein [Sphingomonas nostoxanthinifaciens]
MVGADDLSGRLAETLYTEALLLADEMRGYFDGPGARDRDTLGPSERVLYACESLKATTRLMHVIAWLATRRAVEAGELVSDDGLGMSASSSAAELGRLPTAPRRLILAGIDLYERVERIAAGIDAPVAAASPARVLIQRLERAF